MNTLIHNSVANRDEIPIICKETLNSIGMLDNSLSDLSVKIDSLVEDLVKNKKSLKNKISNNSKIKPAKSARSSKRVSTNIQPTSSATSSSFLLVSSNNSDILSEINCFKDMIENISARKVTLATRAYDFLDHSVKCIDEEIKVIERAMKLNGYNIPPVEDIEDKILGKKFRKSESSSSLEPVYCTCRAIAHGDMISCDNEKCNIEWFHFACVGLTKLPKGDWFCKACKSSLNRR